MKDWLSRATDGGRLNWVELLPYVRRLMHDTPGISGYSPHKLVFNRDRHMAGVPYEGTEGAEAGEWFDGVTKFEEEIRERVAELRQARMDLWNNSHLDAPVYLLGDMVWYRHPVERSAALRPNWVGPHRVRVREGECSYRLWTGQREYGAHVSLMKRYLGPGFGGKPLPLSYERLTRKSKIDETPDTWEIDEIVGHRVKRGVDEFLTKWKGFGDEEAQWLPVENFVFHYSSELVRYAKAKGLGNIPVLQKLSEVEGERDMVDAGPWRPRAAE